MATFVLMQGGGRDMAAVALIRCAILEEANHEPIVPDLHFGGGDDAAPRAITLQGGLI